MGNKQLFSTRKIVNIEYFYLRTFVCKEKLRIETPFHFSDGTIIELFIDDNILSDHGRCIDWVKSQGLNWSNLIAFDQCLYKQIIYKNGELSLTIKDVINDIYQICELIIRLSTAHEILNDRFKWNPSNPP